MWQYFKKHKALIVIAFISSIAVSGTDAAIAYLVKDIMDGIFISKNMTLLKVMPLIISVTFLVRCIARFGQQYSIQFAGQKAVQQIRDDMYQKVIHLPMSYFEGNPTGVIMTKITNDVANLQNAISSALRIFRSGLSVFFLIGIVFYQNFELGLSVLIVAPFLIIIIGKAGKKIKLTSHKIQEYTGLISNSMNESFTGIRVVKSFANEDMEMDGFNKVVFTEMKYKLKQAFITSVSSPLIETLAGLSVAGLILYGGMKVINGEMTTGEFASFLTAFGMMFEPFKKINNYNKVIQTARASSERIFSVLDTHNEILEHNGTQKCDMRDAEIKFDNVSFSYSSDDRKILDNINFTVPYGTSVALVGYSGAGKSTLISLLPRFYDVTSGRITINGTDLREFDIFSLRRNIGIVSQSPFLFNNSIRYNLTYGCEEEVSEEQLLKAAEQAYALDFINELPEGFDTVIGERGSRLSGGQKQRLTIARAMLVNPPILILDEATSALDTESEKMVQKAISNLMQNRTSFTIAHRLSTVIESDVIIVMDSGKISDMGTHAELLERSEYYRNLYEIQYNA